MPTPANASAAYKAQIVDIAAAADAVVESDGTTTETTIQTAINALTGGRTHKETIVLKGSFLVTTAIEVPSYTRIVIVGKLTQQAGGTESGMFVNSDTVGGNTDIEIVGGYLVGETTRTAYQAGIYFDNVDNVLIDGVNISGFENHGIDFLDAVTNFVISNCVCDNNGDDGITVHGSCNGGVIFNNICANGTSATGGSSGIEIESTTASAPNNISVISNVCHTNAKGIHVITDTGATAAIDSIIVSGNVCYNNTQQGITAQGLSAAYPVQNFSYTNNICYGNTSAGISLTFANNGTIASNVIKDNDGGGILANTAKYCTVSGNQCIANDIHGIRFFNSSVWNRIIDNTCLDNGHTTTGYGIRVEGNCNTTIAANTVGNTGGAATPQYGLNLQAAGDVDVLDNYFLDSRNIGGVSIYEGGTPTGNPVRIRNNKASTAIAYITEATGTGSIVSATTSDVITHGLDFTPTAADISITLKQNPTNTPGAIWVDTIGASTFTVNCENDPGASNLDFSWSVQGRKA